MPTQLATRLLLLLDEVPDCAQVVERVIAREEAEIAKYREEKPPEWVKLRLDGLPDHQGIERLELGAPQRLMERLVWCGTLEVVGLTRSHTSYRLADRGEAKRALAAWQPERTPPPEDEELPTDLFQVIAGHDRIKRFFLLSLAAPRPVHGLLEGPPATAKSIFLEELRRLPRYRYIDGGIATKAGIVDYVLAEDPRFLLVDELEYLSPQDQQALHGLMATGRMARLKHGMREDERRLVWVFATCNSSRRLSPMLLDRFQRFRLEPYTEGEFEAAVRSALVKWEGVDAGVATYIGAALARRQSPSIREAVRLGRVARSVVEVDEALAVFRGE